MNAIGSDKCWRWATGLLFGALWTLVCGHLAGHWNANPQYGFGWLVPPLCGYLLWLRWVTRPAPGPSIWRQVRGLVLLLALLFGPAWLIAQPNPDWRLVNWMLAGAAVGLGICAFGVVGGASWARHFAFPVAFLLAAVPWPSGIEQPVVQGLMRVVAAITVEILNLFGTPALQHGNLIELSTGLLGVDEACSGVRSLQATFMAALFLGEFYRFDLSRRAALLVAGVFVALVSNVGRTLFLAWNAAQYGFSGLAQWHDPAGVTILTICFIAIWVIALLIGRGIGEPARTMTCLPSHPFPRAALLGLGLWFGAVLIGTEAWFHNPAAVAASRWILLPPPTSRAVAIEPAAQQMLLADRTVAATWSDERARNWVMYFFEWRPGPSRSRLLARLHRPEHCLPAGGWKLVADRGLVPLQAKGFILSFRAYTFEQKGRRAFVYFCLTQNRASTQRADEFFDESTRRASLQAVLWRERRLGQQVAELVIFDCKSDQEADAAFREIAPSLVEVADQPVVPK